MSTVSVLTPSYRYRRFIEDALASVAVQHGIQVEHVVQDAASDDGTVEALASWQHVRWRSEPDLGQSDGLNRALTRATGEWIGWLNADEFYLPAGLSHLVKIGERTGADVVFGDCVFVDEVGRLLRLLPSHSFNATVLRFYGPFVANCAAVFRRAALDEAPWDVAVTRIMDWELYLKLSARDARFVWTPYPVGAFRVHPGRITAQPASAHRKSYELVFSRYGLSRSKATRFIGRALHGMLKLSGGSYFRQRRAQRLGGCNLRWFATEEGARNAAQLLRTCYGVEPPSA